MHRQTLAFSRRGVPLPMSRIPLPAYGGVLQLSVVPFLQLLGRTGFGLQQAVVSAIRLPCAAQALATLPLSRSELLSMHRHDLSHVLEKHCFQLFSDRRQASTDHSPAMAALHTLECLRHTASASPPSLIPRSTLQALLASSNRTLLTAPTSPCATVGLAVPFTCGLGIGAVLWDEKMPAPPLVAPSAVRGSCRLGQSTHPLDAALVFERRFHPPLGASDAAVRVLALRSTDLCEGYGAVSDADCTGTVTEGVGEGLEGWVWEGGNTPAVLSSPSSHTAGTPSSLSDISALTPASVSSFAKWDPMASSSKVQAMLQSVVGDLVGLTLRNVWVCGAAAAPPAVYAVAVAGTRISFFRFALDPQSASEDATGDALRRGAGVEGADVAGVGSVVSPSERTVWAGTSVVRGADASGGAAHGEAADAVAAAQQVGFGRSVEVLVKGGEEGWGVGGRIRWTVDCDFGPRLSSGQGVVEDYGSGSGCGYGARRFPSSQRGGAEGGGEEEDGVGYDLCDPHERLAAFQILAALRYAVTSKGSRPVARGCVGGAAAVDDGGLDAVDGERGGSDDGAGDLMKRVGSVGASWVQ